MALSVLRDAPKWALLRMKRFYICLILRLYFKILHPDNQVVCQVKMSRASMSIEETDEELEEGAEGAEGAAPSENAESGKEEAKSE